MPQPNPNQYLSLPPSDFSLSLQSAQPAAALILPLACGWAGSCRGLHRRRIRGASRQRHHLEPRRPHVDGSRRLYRPSASTGRPRAQTSGSEGPAVDTGKGAAVPTGRRRLWAGSDGSGRVQWILRWRRARRRRRSRWRRGPQRAVRRIPRRRRPRWRRGRGRGGGHGHGGGEWSQRVAGRADLPAVAADHGFIFSFVFYF